MSCSRQSSAIPNSSSRVSTAPVGLCGLVITIARVRGVIAARSSSIDGWKPCSGLSAMWPTSTPVAPSTWVYGA